MTHTPKASSREAAEAWGAAHAGAVLAARPPAGLLSVTGKDAADLVNRLTTNAVAGLRPGQGTATVFTTAKGRIVDLVIAHRLEDGLLCVTGEGRAAALEAWIAQYTFREDVTARDAGAGRSILALHGPGAAAIVERLFGAAAAALPLHHHLDVPAPPGATEGVAVARAWPLAGDGFHLITAAPAAGALAQRILDASPAVVPIDAAGFEALRIEAGLPRAGRELTEDYNPWEARLNDAISLTKGCYIGQEVVARLNTYKKVSKVLVRLRLEGAAPPAPLPAAIHLDEAAGRASLEAPRSAGALAIGTLTSAAAVPGDGHVLALGYVRDEDARAGLSVWIAAAEGRVPAVVLGPAR